MKQDEKLQFVYSDSKIASVPISIELVIRLYLSYGHGYSKAQLKYPIGTKDVFRRGDLKAMPPSPKILFTLTTRGTHSFFL